MPPLKDDKVAIQDFTKTLELTTELVQQLISDIREGEINFSALSTELKGLVDSVRENAEFVRGNEVEINDLKLKIALLERSVRDLEKWVDSKKQSENQSITSLAVADRSGRWQFFAILTTGFLTLVGTIITILFNSGLIKK